MPGTDQQAEWTGLERRTCKGWRQWGGECSTFNLFHNPPPLKTNASFTSKSLQIPLEQIYNRKYLVNIQVSPSEDSTEGERERLLSETNSKTRSHSGEDAGIGSEQGEFQLPLELRLGKQVIDLQGLNLGFISV